MKVQTFGFYIIGTIFVVIYVGCISLTGLNSPPLIAFSFFPALDVISDILYLVNTSFYNFQLFSACFVFLLAPTFLFIKTLIEYKAVAPTFVIDMPSWISVSLMWLSVTKSGSPLYRGNKLWLSLDEHDTVLKLLYFLVLWICCIIAQLGCLIVLFIIYIPLLALHIPFWLCWIALGAYLMQIKMLSVGKIIAIIVIISSNISIKYTKERYGRSILEYG